MHAHSALLVPELVNLSSLQLPHVQGVSVNSFTKFDQKNVAYFLWASFKENFHDKFLENMSPLW